MWDAREGNLTMAMEHFRLCFLGHSWSSVHWRFLEVEELAVRLDKNAAVAPKVFRGEKQDLPGKDKAKNEATVFELNKATFWLVAPCGENIVSLLVSSREPSTNCPESNGRTVAVVTRDPIFWLLSTPGFSTTYRCKISRQIAVPWLHALPGMAEQM